jgi:hypothetical protein
VLLDRVMQLLAVRGTNRFQGVGECVSCRALLYVRCCRMVFVAQGQSLGFKPITSQVLCCLVPASA